MLLQNDHYYFGVMKDTFFETTRFLERLDVYWVNHYFSCESRLISTYFNLYYIIIQSIFSILAAP